MKADEIEEALRATLDDLRLSRSERRALGELLPPESLEEHDRRMLRDRAFALARQELRDPRAKAVLTWLKGVVNIVQKRPPSPDGKVAECHFSPGEACRRRIQGLLDRVRHRVDICVFTITDDRLSRCVIKAHRRGVKVRIISDDDKAEDLGSDTLGLKAAGVPVAFDRDGSHMHHKFALFDGSLLLSGSYNWTRAAFEENKENVLVTDDRRLVEGFVQEFERLWSKFGVP